MANDALLTLQQDIRYRLLGDSYFDDIPVITETMADADVQVEKALALGSVTKGNVCGACVLVMPSTANAERWNTTRAVLNTSMIVRVLENVGINQKTEIGTGKAASSISERVLKVLYGYQYSPTSMLLPDSPCIAAVDDALAPVAYEVRLRCDLVIGSGDSKVSMPSDNHEHDGDLYYVTLACATTDAIIYYTTDETYPGPDNETAQTYTERVLATTGDVIRACAYRDGYIPSDCLYLSVTIAT